MKLLENIEQNNIINPIPIMSDIKFAIVFMALTSSS